MPYQFHGQRATERLLLFSRQHPAVLFKPLLQAAAICLLPFVVGVVVVTGPILSWTILLSMVIGLVWAGMAIYSWYNTTFLLTDERLILYEQAGPLHREFTEVGLANIQQVSHEVKGLIHTLAGFGHIAVYTGGSQAPFMMRNVPDPYDMQQEIQRAGVGEVYDEEGERA